ncbi:MAG: hypothetical protein AAF721_33235 [Myxococcota bacterium]
MRAPSSRLPIVIAALATLACDAPERTTRSPGVVTPAPKDDDTQDGKPGADEEPPRFVQPDESEATVVLGSGQCVDIAMQLDDEADALELTVDAPSEIAGATLTVDASGYSGHWRWCPGAFGNPPDPGHYEVMLLADDGTHLPTAKSYVVHVEEGIPLPEPDPEDEDPPMDDCDQGWPTIDYQPATLVDGVATVTALFKDDVGIVGFPLVTVSFEIPGEELENPTVYPMELVEGDRTAGLWLVDIPMHGDTMWYRYEAEDTVPGQPCAHFLEEPADGFIELGL